MALIKREYTDKETVITADNMNAIQDAVIALEDGLFSVDNTKSGEVITITDATKRGFRSFSVYGKTTQDGTPTPDVPVDLVSVGDSGSITVNVTGQNDSQSMTVATPNGLPGIPVASGGNYTDANGQQWICDEIDFARGVYVQRVSKKIYGNGERWKFVKESNGFYRYYLKVSDVIATGVPIMSRVASNILPPINVTEWDAVTIACIGLHPTDKTINVFVQFATTEEWEAYLGTNKMTVIYQLATPIVTPLSEEDLVAFATLHTYRGNTTVSNDAGAWMELEYVMDAKKYIDSLIGGGGASTGIIDATVE